MVLPLNRDPERETERETERERGRQIVHICLHSFQLVLLTGFHFPVESLYPIINISSPALKLSSNKKRDLNFYNYNFKREVIIYNYREVINVIL